MGVVLLCERRCTCTFAPARRYNERVGFQLARGIVRGCRVPDDGRAPRRHADDIQLVDVRPVLKGERDLRNRAHCRHCREMLWRGAPRVPSWTCLGQVITRLWLCTII